MGEEIDISLMSYDEWLAFVFDHSVPKDRLNCSNWYWEFRFDVSKSSQLVEHVTRLCNGFPQLIDRYTLRQIDQGIWFILGPCIDFGQYLRDEQISLEARRSCIHSMYKVFADFVSKSEVEEMETCFWMWWDILLEGFYFSDLGQGYEDAQEIENITLETLSMILRLDDLRTQEYALHGLGHLKNKRAREIVAQYIEEHGGNWTQEGREWLETCRNGTVM